ncbi:MAG: hypothetical protein KAK00_08290 [Nanoarchaeota archaeon]|nr:hypothetical protein [Thermodesulfovibrionia bacterium]MCK5283380.1 hypothetical protein [Nanoarchaeota archaeon]
MSKKSKKKKVKKVSAKKEKYAKFKKDKPGTLDVSMPDLNDDQVKQKRTDEDIIDRFLRFNRNLPTKTINPRKMKSKR